jgi:hypothetical protein
MHIWLNDIGYVDSYKHLGVHFRSTENPSHYKVLARDRIGGAYHVMRSMYNGFFCRANVRLVFFLQCHSYLASYFDRRHCMRGSCGAVTLALEQSERESPQSIVNICVAF